VIQWSSWGIWCWSEPHRPINFVLAANRPTTEDGCWPICGQHEINGSVRLRIVWMSQGADCTPHFAWLHQIQTSVPHQWGGQPAILEYLTQSKFWPICIPVHLYERRAITIR